MNQTTGSAYNRGPTARPHTHGVPVRITLFAPPPMFALALLIAGPALADDCPVPAPRDPEAARTVVQVGAEQVTLSELDGRIAAELCKARIEHRRAVDKLRAVAADALVEEKLVAAEAERRKITTDALREEARNQPVAAPTEADLKAFYDTYKERIGAPFDEVKGQIAGFLMQQAMEGGEATMVAALREQHGATVDLPVLRMKVDASGPARGPKKAPVTVVVFADYECPYCARGADNLEAARRKFKDRVRVVYRDFPLGFHKRAIPAAVAARCAGVQGKYWEMHDRLYANQRALQDADLTAHAEAVGLDMKKFAVCRADPRHAAAVTADQAAGEKLGVEGTPAMFVNGLVLTGAQPIDALTALFEKELARAK